MSESTMSHFAYDSDHSKEQMVKLWAGSLRRALYG